MSEDGPLLELTDVTKRYESPGGAPAPAVLDRISLELRAGETLAVTGPSGSGKSTLLNIIGALDRPTSGSVTLGGDEVSALDEEGLARLRNREIGFVFQLHHLLPQCTVLENVLIPTLVAGEAERDRAAERARRLLQRVGLTPRIRYRPGLLSGGERQRVAVVRALINRPRILLADEPTGSLDHDSAENLANLLVELNAEEGVAIVLASHSMELARRMSRVCSLRNGRLREAAGPPG